MRAADWLGWIATAVFLASYSRKNQRTLRLTQAVAALLWVAYGVLLHALPIIVANLLVAGVAAYSSRSPRRSGSAARLRVPPISLTPSGEPDLSRTS
jgi:hypothetical protein